MYLSLISPSLVSHVFPIGSLKTLSRLRLESLSGEHNTRLCEIAQGEQKVFMLINIIKIMEQKTLGKWQLGIGVVSLIFVLWSLLNVFLIGESIISALIKIPFWLLFGLFAVLTGWYNLKK